MRALTGWLSLGRSAPSAPPRREPWQCRARSGRLQSLKITGWGWYYLSTVLDDFFQII